MPSVDDRIVRMEFDNASFERKMRTTLDSLAHLEKALKFDGAQKGFGDISRAANGVNISHIGNAVDATVKKFSTLGVVGFTAIQSITRGILGLAKKVGGDILGPIISGGSSRAHNIEQAKFQFEGLGIDVNKAMDSALEAVKGTSFGLDEAAKAAAQFGASGIGAGEQMTSSLRAISGAAALTGRSFTEIADIFTSSAGTGVVNTQDLQQFATRGLNAAAAVGKVLGKTEKQVREMASSGKLDFKTFSDAMDKAFGSHAKDANKTFSGALANMRAAMSRLGAAFLTPEFEQQRNVFNTLTPVIDNVTGALKPLFNAFLAVQSLFTGKLIKNLNTLNFTGIQNLAQATPHLSKALINIVTALSRIAAVGKAAFRDIFPKSTTSLLVTISIALEKFTQKLIAGRETLSKLRVIFDGVFAALSIGWTVLKEGIKFVAGLAKELFGLQKGNVLNFFVKIAQVIGDFQKVLVTGGGIKDFFAGLPALIQNPLNSLKQFAGFIRQLFTGFDPQVAKKVGDSVGILSNRFERLKSIGRGIQNVFSVFATGLKFVSGILAKIGQVVGTFFSSIGRTISDAIKSGDFNAGLDALNTVIFGGFLAVLHNFLKNGAKLNLDVGHGLFAQIGNTFNQLTGVLKAMQTQIKADALMKIAKAIAILTASVLILSLIDSGKLTKALTAMSVGFGQLLGAFAILNTITAGPKSATSFALVAGGMILLGTALLILSGAVSVMARLDLGSLAKGIGGIAALLVILAAASIPLSDASPALIVAGAGMIAIGIGLDILAGAVKLFSLLPMGDMFKGLLGIGAALLIVGGAASAMPASLPITGAGLIIVSVGLLLLSEAIKAFVKIPTGDIAKGLVVIAAGLIVIGGAMQFMPPSLPITGAGLILVSIGLEILSKALQSFGSMSWGEIARGLTALAGSLIILAIGTNLMGTAIPGAIAIGIVAVSLAALAEVMKTFGDMNWGDLIQGMLKIAAALGILAVASLLLGPAIPAIAGLGIALTIVGAGFALFGVGAFLAAKAFETLSKSAASGSDNIVNALKSFGKAIPALTSGFVEALIGMYDQLIKFIPRLVEGLGKLGVQLLDAIVKMAPKMGLAFGALMKAGLNAFIGFTPQLVAAGFNFLVEFLHGIDNNIGEIVTTVGNIIVHFLQAFQDQIPRVQLELANTLIAYFKGAAFAVGQVAGTLLFGIGIEFLKGFWNGLTTEVPFIQFFFVTLPMSIISWIGNVATRLWNKGIEIISGFFSGINDKIIAVRNFFGSVGGKILGWIGSLFGTLRNKGLDIIGGFFRGITDKWHEVTSWFAGLWNLISQAVGDLSDILLETGKAIIQGLWDGMQEIWGKVSGWLSSLNPANLFNDINLQKGHAEKNMVPTGEMVFFGLQKGMETGWDRVTTWLQTLDPSDSLSKVLATIPAKLSSMEEFNPTITPVLDLSRVTSEAAKISSLVSTSALVPSVSTIQANRIASTSTASPNSIAEKSPVGTPGEVKFEQNIYAPEQLSTKDIYKQTRNQITLAKEELSIT